MRTKVAAPAEARPPAQGMDGARGHMTPQGLCSFRPCANVFFTGSNLLGENNQRRGAFNAFLWSAPYVTIVTLENAGEATAIL